MDINELMTRFRLASRELFNYGFRVPDPYATNGWEMEERFARVEGALFEHLVMETAGISGPEYGDAQPLLQVELRAESVAANINREIKCGYWDFPVKQLSQDAELLFVEYFNFDQLGVRDNWYVRVLIKSWPSHPEAVGKHALVQSHSVRFLVSTRTHPVQFHVDPCDDHSDRDLGNPLDPGA